MPLALLYKPPPTVDQLCGRRHPRRRRTRVTATTREEPIHRRQRTHARARDEVHPCAKQTAPRFVDGGGRTHVLLAMLFQPPPTVAALRPRMQACTHTGRCRNHRRRQTRVATTARGADPPTAAHARPQCVRPKLLQRKTKRKHALPRWRDSLSARHVGVATADGGVTEPAHTGMHAHRQTQTPAPTSNTTPKHAWRRLREGPTH